MKKVIVLLITHMMVAAMGFAGGIYILPVLIDAPAPTQETMATAKTQSEYEGEFVKSLKDSDFLHWGEGRVLVGQQQIALEGKLAPGPDYKLYLSTKFIETEAEFLKNKSEMVQVADIKTFTNFVVPVPSTVDVSSYSTVIIWCEAFSQFITAASYK
ncbi:MULTISPECIES: DM13 domain-containing protein [unclassified Neptuniibacter]|uniref:DM13 domain-containing protein n=1 Tax=unclassified Neptuniibacter TaxID=2630693 RepID=UPI0025DDBE6C|nr:MULTISPECIES: DM13 domain-containing protein [unclassified Neptuniibacter]|tara:strand:+ start:32063 stop:32533 length:471 start_codon:yes stop_codon:yes gene_type:complete